MSLASIHRNTCARMRCSREEALKGGDSFASVRFRIYLRNHFNSCVVGNKQVLEEPELSQEQSYKGGAIITIAPPCRFYRRPPTVWPLRPALLWRFIVAPRPSGPCVRHYCGIFVVSAHHVRLLLSYHIARQNTRTRSSRLAGLCISPLERSCSQNSQFGSFFSGCWRAIPIFRGCCGIMMLFEA